MKTLDDAMARCDPTKLYAPWSDEHVERLRKHQANRVLHSYTCEDCSNELTPTKEGWVCSQCGCEQYWSLAPPSVHAAERDAMRKELQQDLARLRIGRLRIDSRYHRWFTLLVSWQLLWVLVSAAQGYPVAFVINYAFVPLTLWCWFETLPNHRKYMLLKHVNRVSDHARIYGERFESSIKVEVDL